MGLRINKEQRDLYTNRGNNELDHIQERAAAAIKDQNFTVIAGPKKFEADDLRGGGSICYAVSNVPNRNTGLYNLVAVKRTPASHTDDRDAKNIETIYEDKEKPPSPNLAEYYGHCTKDGFFYFICEYLEHAFWELNDHVKTTAGLTDSLIQLCSGIEDMHRKEVIHRDVRPANVRFTKDKATNEILVRLIDYGLACGLGSSLRVQSAKGYMGHKKVYAGPELTRKDEKDVTCDILPIGMMGWELFTGLNLQSEMVKNHDNIEDLQEKIKELNKEIKKNPDKSSEIESKMDWWHLKYFADSMPEAGNRYLTEIFRKAMQPEITERYQTATAMKQDLMIALESEALDTLLSKYAEFNSAVEAELRSGEAYFSLDSAKDARNKKRELFALLAKRDLKEDTVRSSPLIHAFQNMVEAEAMAGSINLLHELYTGQWEQYADFNFSPLSKRDFDSEEEAHGALIEIANRVVERRPELAEMVSESPKLMAQFFDHIKVARDSRRLF